MPDNSQPGAIQRQPASAGNVRKTFGLVAFAASSVFAFTVVLAVCVYYLYGPDVDFVSFWAAGRLALQGHSRLAYDVHAHQAVEQTVAQIGGLMPFPYPPPFLFFVSVFAWAVYPFAYLLWISATAGLYFVATRRLTAPRFAFAHPAATVNAIIGQNGFLISGIFLLGISRVPAAPFTAGLLLGLLVIKPQLGVLLPVALLASRQWRAIGGAAASSLTLLAAAALVFGLDSYRGFFAMTQQYAAFMAADRWDWAQQASVFGFSRFLGASQPMAFTIQGTAAFVAATVTWRAWVRGSEQREAILAAATLLVPPYVFAYDSLLLVLPLAMLLKDGERPWRAAILWVCLLAPLPGYFGLYPGPNTIPVAAALSLWWLTGRDREFTTIPQLHLSARAECESQ
jgi:hypothetical protein